MSRQRTNSENKDTDEFAQRLPSHRAFLSCVDTGGWRDTAIAPDPMELQTCPLHLSVYYYGVKVRKNRRGGGEIDNKMARRTSLEANVPSL